MKIDLKKKKNLISIFKKWKPSIVYHLASQPGIMYSFKNPKTYITNNISVTKNLIDVSLKYKVKKFYFTSSCSVYGDKEKFPIKEKSKLKPINIYAKKTKNMKKYYWNSSKNDNVDLKIFRPFTVYGPLMQDQIWFYNLYEQNI